MRAKIPPIRAGDLITEGWLNKIVDAANQANLTVGDGGSLALTVGPDGYSLSSVVSTSTYGKITGPISGGQYPFTEQFPDTGGTWVAGTTTGTAYEQNNNPSVSVNTIVELKWSSAGYYQFERGSC